MTETTSGPVDATPRQDPVDTGAAPGAGSRPIEAGYVMPMTALLLIPLMIFAAFATDVGAWYVKADQAQRAADAAALAGTVWLPNTTQATAVARDVAARNGFRDPAWVAVNGGVSNATVSVPGVTADGGLEVSIVTDSESYFGKVVLDSVEIERRSIANKTEPVRLGNPSNGLGTGNLAVAELGFPPDGVWLSLNGWCYDHQNGDPVSVGYAGTRLAGGNIYFPCTGPNGGANPTHDPDGYTFVVDVPPGAGSVVLEIFEPGLCNDANTGDIYYSAYDYSASGPRINARVYANDDTELYHEDNLATTPVANVLYAANACTGGGGGGGRWYPIHTIPGGAANEGRWYIQTSVRPNTTETGKNDFALRARPSGDTQLCTSMVTSTCPEIYALDWLPVWRPPFGGSGAVAEFFLADISDEHAGKTVQITMFDPGEGMHNVQFRDPAGTSMPFTYELVNCSVGEMCGNATEWPDSATPQNDFDCSGQPCLRVDGTRVGGQAIFQDQWVRVDIELPATYTCGGNCWWKIRYTPSTGATVNDRTTWSVKVVGGPVHLVE